MLYNWFAGFIGAIFRVLLSAGISLLLLFRLDKFVLTTGYEFLDFGKMLCFNGGTIVLHYDFSWGDFRLGGPCLQMCPWLTRAY